MDVPVCAKCNTPLDENGSCVTCAAEAQGLKLLSRSGYASVKEMMELLEEQGVAAEIEQVPARREEERARPLWNLYAPAPQVAQAVSFLQRDWTELLSNPEAARAAPPKVDFSPKPAQPPAHPPCGRWQRLGRPPGGVRPLARAGRRKSRLA